MISTFALKKAIQFYSKAVTPYQVHGPFAFRILKEVVFNNRNYYGFSDISNLRQWYDSSTKEIELSDFGAGSKNPKKVKTLAEISQGSASGENKGKVLFNLCRLFKPENILEIGTNVGFGTAFLATANKQSKIVSLEGDPALIAQAKESFQFLNLKNIEIVPGKFEDTLEATCKRMKKLDLVFLDGNHTYQATLDYFKLIQNYLHPHSIVVLDDIYWSEGMTKAWDEIKVISKAKISIDLFQFGILFYNPEAQKEDLKIVPLWMKPWKNGLFG